MAHIWIPKELSLWDYIRSLERFRPKGQPAGSYIAGDLVDQRLSVLLCTQCRSGFNHTYHKYYPISERDDIYAGGVCENCRITSDQLFLYIPEEKVSQVIVTPDEERHTRRHATFVGG